eukprot:EG_transcript_26674
MRADLTDETEAAEVEYLPSQETDDGHSEAFTQNGLLRWILGGLSLISTFIMGLVAVYFRHCREGEDAETALLDEKQPSLMLTMRQTTLNMIASAGLVKDRTDNSMPVEVVISLPEVVPAVKPHLPMAQSSTEIPACMAAGHSTLLCDDISYLVRPQESYLPSRNSRILDLLLSEPPTVICLQEFWICNDKLASMYQGAFG